MNIPATLSGRPITPRGIHFQPLGHHAGWCEDPVRREKVLDLLDFMHMSYALLLTSGRSVLDIYGGKRVVEHLLERGFYPIIRDSAGLPAAFRNIDTVKETVAIYKDFGVTPIWQLWNEPGADVEWNGDVPEDWWEIFCSRWIPAAYDVMAAGAYVLFADGPGYDWKRQHPFRDIPADIWLSGSAGFGLHNYCKNRPEDHPLDVVAQTGYEHVYDKHGNELSYPFPEDLSECRCELLTMEEFHAQLDDFATDQQWNEHDLSLEAINAQRLAWAERKGPLDEDVCWNEWRVVDFHAREVLNHPVPMATCEGGYQPRDQAGTSQPNIDRRYVLTTPKAVARQTPSLYKNNPMFAICPWLLGNRLMGGSGWEYDAWWNTAYMNVIDQDTGKPYGERMPVVQALHDNPPGQVPTPANDISQARSLLGQALNLPI